MTRSQPDQSVSAIALLALTFTRWPLMTRQSPSALAPVPPAAMHRVEIEQVRMGGRIAGRIVDLHEIQLRPIPGRTQGQATDAAETVDAYFMLMDDSLLK